MTTEASTIPDDFLEVAEDAWLKAEMTSEGLIEATVIIAEAIFSCVMAERERCAVIAEEKGQQWDSPRGYEREACNQVAAAIRGEA